MWKNLSDHPTHTVILKMGKLRAGEGWWFIVIYSDCLDYSYFSYFPDFEDRNAGDSQAFAVQKEEMSFRG